MEPKTRITPRGLNEKPPPAAGNVHEHAAAARILDLLDDKTTPSRVTVLDKSSLSPHEQATVRDAQMSQVWTILENTRAKKMKGMGRVPEGTAEEIDKHLNEMLALVNTIMQTVKPMN